MKNTGLDMVSLLTKYIVRNNMNINKYSHMEKMQLSVLANFDYRYDSSYFALFSNAALSAKPL